LLTAATGLAASVALTACSAGATSPVFISPTGAAVRAAERARARSGRVVTAALTAAPAEVDLAGRTAATWSFGGLPAPVIRARAGDTIRVTLANRMDDPTSVHWHGLALRNDMDGVPGLTQSATAPGGSFDYEFTASDPGTYWFHPHVGAQLDRGLYGALIVDDPHEPLAYDDEWVIVLDDWLDGVTATPDQVLAELSQGMSGGMGMGGMPMRMGNTLMGTNSDLLGGDAGDVYYPLYLINGKPPGDPAQFTAKPGTRVRLRIINAGSDTAFRLALGGHRLTVTHTDGYPVEPAEADSVLLGMGERLDALATLSDGVFPLVASAEGKQAAGFAVVRTGSGAAPTPQTPVPELSGRTVVSAQLTAAGSARLEAKDVDRELTMRLSGSMMRYDWAVNGRRFDEKHPLAGALAVTEGERVRLRIVNDTTMWHPVHLHGHTWQLGNTGARKDTSIVLPKKTLTVLFDAANPGRWAAHCHNIYHAEAGMMTALAYRD
jgi:FtsP/CotA-like multicopper oxidase with cupredoxin domain